MGPVWGVLWGPSAEGLSQQLASPLPASTRRRSFRMGGSAPGIPQARAKADNTILLYGIGFGPVTPTINAGLIVQQANALAGFQVSFAGVPATVQFAGLVSGLVGLYQFNVVVPKRGR